jgi:hypothetical protein
LDLIGERNDSLFPSSLGYLRTLMKRVMPPSYQGYAYNKLYDEGSSSAEHKANRTTQEDEIETEPH